MARVLLECLCEHLGLGIRVHTVLGYRMLKDGGWLIQAHRTPGGTLSDEYYKGVREYTPRYLVEMFDCMLMRTPESAEDVLKWTDNHYRKNTYCRGFFNGWEDQIQQAIEDEEKR